MSLKGSGIPLRIELSPSRYYRWLIWGAHLLTLLPVLSLAWERPLFLLAVPMLLLSLSYAWRGYLADSRWQHLRCFRDGRVECLDRKGKGANYLLSHPPVIFPWMVILALGRGKARYWIPLFPDAMLREQWLDLRRFLRYSLD